MSILQKTKRGLFVASAFFFLSLFISSVAVISQEENFSLFDTKSNVGIVPTNPGDAPLTKAWFIETINPGNSVEQSATITNGSDQDLPVIVLAKDAIQTAQGSFTFKENEEENTEVGNWIDFIDEPRLTVPANSSVDFRFKINVPDGTSAGEYAGVIAVQQDRSEEDRGGVQILMRIGSRVYVTVPGDLQMNTEVDTFEFLTDDNEQYSRFLQTNPTANYKNVYLNIGLENASNVFTTISGTAKVTDPDGEEFTQQFNRQLAPNTSVAPSWLNMQQEWKIGTYKAVYEWQNEPVVDLNKENVADNTDPRSVEIELQMTQAKLDEMAKLQEEADQENRLPAAVTDDEVEKDNTIEQLSAQETAADDNTILYLVISSLGAIVVVMGGVLGYFAYRNSKKEEAPGSSK